MRRGQLRTPPRWWAPAPLSGDNHTGSAAASSGLHATRNDAAIRPRQELGNLHVCMVGPAVAKHGGEARMCFRAGEVRAACYLKVSQLPLWRILPAHRSRPGRRQAVSCGEEQIGLRSQHRQRRKLSRSLEAGKFLAARNLNASGPFATNQSLTKGIVDRGVPQQRRHKHCGKASLQHR